MTKSERSWNLVYAIVLVTFTSIPYILGYFNHGDTWQFTGFVFGVEDGNSYIAKMLLGAQGDWLFRTPYTPHPQSGVLAFLPYLLIGKLAGGVGLHEQMVALFHLFRAFATPVAVFATYHFISSFVTSIWWRRWATILATAGGGLGWFLILIGSSSWLGTLPLEFYSPETFGFLSLYGLPHLILARAFLLYGLAYYLQSVESAKSGWITGLFFLGILLLQPLTIIPAYAVIAVHLALITVLEIRSREWNNIKPWVGGGLRILLLSSPLLIYLGLSFTRDPFLNLWTSQNLILSPHPAQYLAAYALILLPALMGMRRIIRERESKGLILIGWVVIFPLLAYAPFNLQRRLPEGVWVAFLSLAAMGLMGLLGERGKSERWIGRTLLAFGLMSTLLLLTAGINAAIQPNEPVFRVSGEVKAFSWLKSEGEAGSVVLAAYPTGNAIPAWAPVRVVIGHGPESVNLTHLAKQIDAFYSQEMTDADRLQFLELHDVRYVWYGPREKALGSWSPNQSDDLTFAFNYKDHTIYRVKSSNE
jgi:hypothetical protein